MSGTGVEIWQIAVVILILLIPAVAAVAVTIWTVPRPGDNYRKEPARRIDTSTQAVDEEDQ